MLHHRPRAHRAPLAATLLAVVLTLLGGMLVAPPGAEAATRRAAAPSTTYPQAMLGEKIAFLGRIGTTKRPIVLQRKAGKKWRTVARRTTDAKGRYTLGYINRARAGTAPAYRVVAPAKRGRAKITSRAMRLPSVIGTVTVDWPTPRKVNSYYRSTITVSPARPGRSVYSQLLQADGTWGESSGSSFEVLDANSQYSFISSPGRAGTWTIRYIYGDIFVRDVAISAPVTFTAVN